ncbi:VanZ like family protein [Filimonas lacunae]|uniref:VanZ like family protein n=1 Tax=Filimonas lacunae TaxID=477680 RepID=A0A173MP21_9BACT|nr:VanZ family protein [Filimonas lacunae]BAV09227.1 hypothetical protein FLA_5275 [Filimonas lacunae]SIS69339.1 VanZ like family protein [Filimonas lacunae]
MKKISLALLPAILFFFLSYYLLTIPGKELPEVSFFDKIPLFDKWVHIGMFSILVYLFSLAFKQQIITNKRLLPLLAATGLVYGIAMEYVQKYYVANRSFDLTDIIADGVGCVIGALLIHWQIKRSRAKQESI